MPFLFLPAFLTDAVQHGIITGKGKAMVLPDMIGEIAHLLAIQMDHFAADRTFQMEMVMTRIFQGKLVTGFVGAVSRKLEKIPILHQSLDVTVDGGKVDVRQSRMQVIHGHGRAALLKESGNPRPCFCLVFVLCHHPSLYHVRMTLSCRTGGISLLLWV